MINDRVKNFIENHINLIENNEWDEIYKLTNNLSYDDIGKFTEVMLEANINPLDYLDYIPKYYLYDSKNISGKFIIPDHIKSIGEGVFYNCRNLRSVIIPDSIKSIGDYAFENCSKLTSITIPNSVTSIGGWVFYNCSKLTSITIFDGVMSIGQGAFRGCSGLTSVVIPDSITHIGYGAFYNCKKLKDIYYNGTKEQWQKIGKESDWRVGTDIEVIHCSDGDIKG